MNFQKALKEVQKAKEKIEEVVKVKEEIDILKDQVTKTVNSVQEDIAKAAKTKLGVKAFLIAEAIAWILLALIIFGVGTE